MRIHYLEIVTDQVDAVCASYEQVHGMKFSEPVAALGNARTAPRAQGGLLGVREPMNKVETPVVRPYVLVENIQTTVKAAEKAGGEIALPPTDIPGHGTFAIYIQGGIHHGLWQL